MLAPKKTFDDAGVEVLVRCGMKHRTTPALLAPGSDDGHNRTAASERLWAAGALLYAFGISVAVLWLLPWKTASVPSLLIALGLPLTLRLVPRNWLYGLRTKRTLRTTREVWYFQNRITGMVLVGVGVVWLGVLVVRW